MLYSARFSSPAGMLTLKSDGQALISLTIDHSDEPPFRDPLPLFSQAEAWLSAYFAGRNPGPVSFPLKPAGTEFQQQVWQLLLEIPYGETVSYGTLAGRLALLRGIPRMSAQAVGQAVGRNPIAIFIPCHRVLGSQGQLTGYAYGLACKRQLLTLEGSL